MAAFQYRIVAHEYVDDAWTRVRLRCLGYSSNAAHPEEWGWSLLVPVTSTRAWPIGKMVRLSVGG